YNYYYDEVDNWPAGNPNMVYDAPSKSYYLVELDRDLNYSLTSALHVKHVDLDGNLLDTKYYITDFFPYSGHYISTIQVQNDDLVIFLNRNMGYPHVHDVFVMRIPKDLQGAPESQRLYRQDDGELYLNSIKVNESVPFGGKILFTGSVFTRGELNSPTSESCLLIGVINEDESIDYEVFFNGLEKIEGLSLMANYKELAFYVSCRFSEPFSKQEQPLLLKANLGQNNQISLQWSQVYPQLSVDRSDYTSYNKGLELPIIDRYSKYQQPVFLARDFKNKHLVLTMFSKNTGLPYTWKSQFFPLPEDKKLELVDAIKYTKKDGLAVLFTRLEQFNDVNTNSFVMHTSDVFDYSISPTFSSLNTATEANSALGRRFMQVSATQTSVGLFANPANLGLDFPVYHRASLIQANTLPFRCVKKDPLKKPFEVSVTTYANPLYEIDVIVSEEDRLL
ncbi:MAG: hypothetical protein AAFQ87_27265, partial [Bacteroidota bacterium]